MKTQLHQYLSRKQITSFLTEIANTKVNGLKVKTKSLLNALAQREGYSSSEAYLNSIDKQREGAFTVTNKGVVFYETNGVFKLVSIQMELKVNGYFDRTISIVDGMIGNDGYLMKCEVNGTVGTSGALRIEVNSGSDKYRDKITERMKYSQIALNYAMDLAIFVNSNIKLLHPSDFDGWDVKIYEQKKD